MWSLPRLNISTQLCLRYLSYTCLEDWFFPNRQTQICHFQVGFAWRLNIPTPSRFKQWRHPKVYIFWICCINNRIYQMLLVSSYNPCSTCIEMTSIGFLNWLEMSLFMTVKWNFCCCCCSLSLSLSLCMCACMPSFLSGVCMCVCISDNSNLLSQCEVNFLCAYLIARK